MLQPLVEHDLRANAKRLPRGKPVSTFPDHAVERDEFDMNRRRALASCVGMTFPDHALMRTIIQR